MRTRNAFALALCLLAGSLVAGESLPTPNFQEPTGQGWDKPVHFAAGAMVAEWSRVIVGCTGEVTGLWKRHSVMTDTVAPIVAAALAGACKEYFDAQEPGNKWDNSDLAATVLGSLPAAGIRITWEY